ncbi:MAG TPA: hypothetical protein VGM91_20175 [Conexibacter sp.]
MLFENLCIEFELTWDAMASTVFSEQTGASFLFARQAMLLVELASSVASQDHATFRRFAAELQAQDARLFKSIPAYKSGPQTRKCVPRIAPVGDARSDLITLLFDLMRNGLAHYGHQVYAPLADGRAVGVVLLDSMWRGRTLESVRDGGKTIHHLSCTLQADGNLAIRLCPAILYLDVRDASESAGVWDLEVDATEFTVGKRVQKFGVADLVAALEDPTDAHMVVFKP